MMNELKRFYTDKNDERKVYFHIFAYLMSLAIALFIFYAGARNDVFASLMVLPIVLVASTNGGKYGVMHAFVSGLMIGPLMPTQSLAAPSADPFSWLIRILIFATVALVVGFFAEQYQFEIKKRIEKDQEISDAHLSTIFAMTMLSESRDDETGSHIKRVAEYCRTLSRHLRRLDLYQAEINDPFIENIYQASPLHDIGKVAVSDRILLKNGALTEVEYEAMKQHTILGAETLNKVKARYPSNQFLNLGASIVKHHHERWDGTGYPDRLSGESIPVCARILALADVYDALRSKRVYKEAMSHTAACQIIADESGRQFDPEMVEVFLEHHRDFERIFSLAIKGYSSNLPYVFSNSQ